MERPDETDPWSISKPTLYNELRRCLHEEESAVLATIVDVEGSAYRRPGAKMLVSSDSESFGAVTAGCLEGPVVDLAASVREDGQPRIETFDLMDDDEWGLGLGCNGIIDLLLEPVDCSFSPVFSAIAEREPVTVLTAVASTIPSVSIGDRTVLGEHGDPLGSDARKRLPSDIVDKVKSMSGTIQNTGGAKAMDVTLPDGDVTVLVDSIQPTPRLLLFGNQKDIQPVSRLGRQVGFEVVVASARGARSNSEDFPYAHDVMTTHPTDLPGMTDDLTYVVLMSHNFLDDRLALEALETSSDVPYIGLMGPRERFERMIDELAAEGTTFTESQLDRISTPVGLDLGGGQPIQIGLSIVSEVLAVHNDRSGGRLRDKEGPIHERLTAGDPNQ